jgi:hypothetical protein
MNENGRAVDTLPGRMNIIGWPKKFFPQYPQNLANDRFRDRDFNLLIDRRMQETERKAPNTKAERYSLLSSVILIGRLSATLF